MCIVWREEVTTFDPEGVSGSIKYAPGSLVNEAKIDIPQITSFILLLLVNDQVQNK